MAKKLKLLIFQDHDIIIRHFIQSGVFLPMMEKHDTLFYFPEPAYKPGKRITIDLETLGLGERIRRLPIPDGREKLWTKLSQVSRLRWQPGKIHAPVRKMIRRAIGPRNAKMYSRLALPGVYQWFERKTLADIAALPNLHLDRVLDAEKPDMLIYPTTLYGPYLHDLCEASKQRGIPLALIMNSWDNIATKANMYLRPDWLLVWGEQTLRHANEYLGMPPEKVVIIGPAQFDVYRQPPRYDREEFRRLHNVAPTKKLLLYAGTSKYTDEFGHLQALDQAIENGELGNTTVIYRPHPWGNCGADGGKIANHPWRHVCFEHTSIEYIQWVAAHPGEKKFNYPDYRDTNNLLHTIDALITPLSTILLESALHGIPSLCHMPLSEEAFHFHQARTLSHFIELYDMPEFLKAWGDDQLLPKTKELMNQVGDSGHAEKLRKAASFFVATFEAPYGERLINFVEDVCDGKGSRVFI